MNKELFLLLFFFSYVLHAQPKISAFYAEKGGILNIGEKVELIIELSHLSAGRNYSLKLEVRSFDRDMAVTRELTVKASEEGRKVLHEELKAPEEPGYYIVRAAVDGKHSAECAFGVVPEFKERDPFFGLNVNTVNWEFSDIYEKVGIGALEIGFPFHFFTYIPDEPLEKYKERLAQHQIIKKQLASFSGGRYEFVGRLSAEFPMRERTYREKTSLAYRAEAIERSEKQNFYAYPDDRYRHMHLHALALYDLFEGKVKNWINMGEIDCRIISMTKNLASGLKSVEIANEVLGTRTYYNALKSRDKKTKLAALGLSGADFFINLPPFQLSKIIMHDISGYFDVISVDAYTGNYGPVGEITPPEAGKLQEFLNGLRALSQEFGQNGEIYQSERGYHEYHNIPLDSAESEKYANYSIRSLIIAKGTLGVKYYSFYNGIRSGWHTYYPLFAEKKDFIDGTMWIVALKENSNQQQSYWTNIPRYEAVAFASATRKLAFAEPFRMNRINLSYDVLAYMFRKNEQMVCAIWSTGEPVSMKIASELEIEVCDLSGRESLQAPGELTLALSAAPQFLTLKANAGELRKMLTNAEFGENVPFTATATRISPTLAIVSLRNKLEQVLTIRDTDREYNLPASANMTMEATIDAKATKISFAANGKNHDIAVPEYKSQPISFSENLVVDADLSKYFAPFIELVSPDHVYPREVIVPESSDALKFDGMDISADISLAWDEQFLYIGARVRDRQHIQRYSGKDIWRDDSMQFAIIPNLRADNIMASDGFAEGVWNFAAALCSNGPSIYRFQAGKRPGMSQEFDCVIKREDKFTTYEIAVPWKDIGVNRAKQGDALAINFVFFDNNDLSRETARHYLALTEGLAGGQNAAKFNIFSLDKTQK
jgi:hypothetical protein